MVDSLMRCTANQAAESVSEWGRQDVHASLVKLDRTSLGRRETRERKAEL